MKRFIVCVDRFDESRGWIWTVRTGGKWLNAHTVHVGVPTTSVFKGASARQPRAYLEGEGVIHDDGHGTITISTT